MAAWNTQVAGSWNQAFNAANTPSAPAFSAGDWLFIYIYPFQGTPTMATPAGWTLLSPNSGAPNSYVFALLSVTGAESMPSMTLGTNFSWACVFKVSGGPASVAGIVHASADRISTSTSGFVFPTSGLTVTQPNCLIIACSCLNKTSAQDAATVTNFGGGGNGFGAPLTSNVPAGNNRTAGVINTWIQTTATNVAAGGNTLSIAAGTNQGTQGSIIALLSNTGGGGAGGQEAGLLGVGS